MAQWLFTGHLQKMNKLTAQSNYAIKPSLCIHPPFTIYMQNSINPSDGKFYHYKIMIPKLSCAQNKMAKLT